MNKKSKEIVKKLCFTLVIVISIITIIGCPNTVSNKAKSESTEQNKPNPPTPPLPTDPNDWSGLTADQVIQKIETTKESEIVTDLNGLGFGMIDNKLCLSYGEVGALKGTPMLLFDAKTEIEKKIGNWSGYPTKDAYSSIKDGLEERWKATKETKRTKEGEETDKWLLFSSRSTSELDGYLTSGLGLPNGSLKNVGFFQFDAMSQRFAVDKNKDIIVFITDTLTIHFADWHVVFVEKATDPKMYSFHYGPYTLKNKRDKDPDLHVPNYESCNLHVFTLSEMLKGYLKKKGKEDIADKVVEKFPPLLPESKDKYDVYLVLGEVYNAGGTTFYCYDHVHRSFRNVFKLSDYAYWKDCWEKDESVKTTSP